MKRITICGAGSLGHVCLGVLASHEDVQISLLTHKPEQWDREITVTDPDGHIYVGASIKASSQAEDVIPAADIVLLCLPGFLIPKTLQEIKPFLSSGTSVGSIVSSTGFFFAAHEILSPDTPLWGFQRVPFIARVVEYGRSANLLGYKPVVSIACEHVCSSEELRSEIQYLFNTKTTLLGSFYEAALTNSNPILHTGRLYSMWHHWDGQPFDRCSLFYKEWDTESAQCLIDMDREFMALLDCLPMDKGSIPSLLEYYEQHDAESLAEKLRSIPAFQSILSPMKQIATGMWVPDFSSRYFTEDFPYGLRFIIDLAHEHNIDIPTLDKVYQWGMQVTE